MKLSIFTPTHNTKYLLDTYTSIKEQDFDEWVIISNNGAKVQDEILKDERVKVFNLDIAPKYVGALKKYACSKCTGDIFVELDHDDILTPDALKDIKEAFTSEIGFVYSNSANFKDDFQPTEKYSSNYGWKYREYEFKGHKLDEALAFKEYPVGLSKIWYCPNHVRAWRKEAYEKAGGHSEDMRVLDDQDLIARTYLVTKFKHIDKCLYLYRITGENTWLKHNGEIQENVMRIHNEYVEKIALKWAQNNNLLSLDMGAAHNRKEGYKSCDIVEGCDFQFDASKVFPFADNSVGVVRSYDFLEHIPDKIHIINEVHRVLAHGGMFFSMTPSATGKGAFRDPTHNAYYVDESFWYYTDPNYANFVPQVKARFNTDTLKEIERFGLPYVQADLVAVKDTDLPGEDKWR
jgi:O-antigen biosynthesis protein